MNLIDLYTLELNPILLHQKKDKTSQDNKIIIAITMLFLKLIILNYIWFVALLEILQCHDCLLQNNVVF